MGVPNDHPQRPAGTTPPSPPADGGPERKDGPPILGSWRNVYLLLASVLAAEIAVMAWITHHFHR